MLRCPLCHSERIHRSKRKRIMKRSLLAMISVRPFRCERCDFRFFRWSFTAKPNASGTVTTS
jgi:predicted Zn-ribbon and HTH transcriptional regulator